MARPKTKTRLPIFDITVDLGKSQIKVVYTHSDSTGIMYLSPEIVPINAAQASSLDRQNANPEDDAYLLNTDGSGFVLGHLATSEQYQRRGIPSQTALKIVTAIPKIQAVFGILSEAEHFNLKPNTKGRIRYAVNLAVLLPLSEWNTRTTLKADLPDALQGFDFRHRRHEIHLNKLEILPESSGALLRYQRETPVRDYRRNTVLSLMLGHFNSTLFLTRNGVGSNRSCISLGFETLIGRVVRETALDHSRMDASALTKAIFYGRWKSDRLYSLLLPLCGMDRERTQQEVDCCLAAIESAAQTQWLELSQWLSEQLQTQLSNLDAVLVVGGTAQFFRSELKQFFAPFGKEDLVRYAVSPVFQSEISEAFNIEAWSPELFRIADAYSVQQYLHGTKLLNHSQQELKTAA